MTTVYIIEAQIPDMPSFEVFVNVTSTFREAEEIVRKVLQDEIDDYGEGGKIISELVGETQVVFNAVDGNGERFLSNHFVTKREI